MKHTLVLIIILFSFTLHGQDTSNQTTTEKHNKLLVGINFSPDIGYRTLNEDNDNALNSTVIDQRNSNEQASFGYTAGLNIKYNLSKKLGLEMGAQYSRKGYATKESELIFGDIIDPRRGFIYPVNNSELPTKVKINYNYNYLDIPVRVIFSFGKKKVQFSTSLGITTNILIKANQTSILEYEDGHTKRENQDSSTDFNKFNISPTISAGISYQISKKLKLNIEPTFRYGLLKTTNTSITENLWNIGLNITCYYTIK